MYRQIETQSQGSNIQGIINYELFAESSLSDFLSFRIVPTIQSQAIVE